MYLTLSFVKVSIFNSNSSIFLVSLLFSSINRRFLVSVSLPAKGGMEEDGEAIFLAAVDKVSREDVLSEVCGGGSRVCFLAGGC